MQLINPNTSPNELNTTLTPHSIIHGNACFAYFNKIWGIPSRDVSSGFAHSLHLQLRALRERKDGSSEPPGPGTQVQQSLSCWQCLWSEPSVLYWHS